MAHSHRGSGTLVKWEFVRWVSPRFSREPHGGTEQRERGL